MIVNLSKNRAIEILLADTYADWSYRGAEALVDWLEEIEEYTGEPSVFDPVALRCDFTEYASWDSACGSYELSEEEIRGRTTCIDFGSCGVIIAEF